MKAIVKAERDVGIAVEDRPKPVPGENDILIKIEAASLCGSDLHVYDWEPSEQNKILTSLVNVPVVMGHEFSGSVVDMGPGVEGFAEGDLVTAMPGWPCGACINCTTGRSTLCTAPKAPGMYRSDGFMQEYVCLPSSATILKLPDTPSVEAYALTEPLTVCLKAVEIAQPQIGLKTAILGPGPIGLLTMQLLKLVSPELLIVTGASADTVRLDMAKKMGADVVINVEETDPVMKVMELTGGVFTGGLDIVFEAAGSPAAIKQGLGMLKPGGTLIVLGIHSQPVDIDTFRLVMANQTIRGVIGTDKETWQKAVGLIASGKVDTASLITHRLPFSEAEKGFRLAADKTAVKVIFVPDN